MQRLILIVGVLAATLTIASAQEATLTGTDQLFSRSYAGLIGPVRTVLSVSKRPEGPSARTFATSVETFAPNGAITNSLFHHADIEHHTGQLVSLDWSRSFAHDSNGKLRRCVWYAPDGTVTGKDEYRYDSGRLIENIDFSRDGTISQRNGFSYEPSKRQTTVTWITYNRGKPSTTYFVYNFDIRGRAIERTTLNADRSLNHRIVYSYDARGNLAKEEHYNEKNVYGWGQTYTYKLDAKGNWYERETMYTQSDRKPSLDMVTYRVITYYANDR